MGAPARRDADRPGAAGAASARPFMRPAANCAPSDGKVCYFSEDMVTTTQRSGLPCSGLFAIALALATVVATSAPTGAASDLRLIDAAARPDAGTVQALLGEGVDVNTARADGVTALLWAAHWDDLDLVALLLDAGADPNAADDHGVTPLMRACENASAAVVRALLDAGADANAAQESGLTALMIAARTGSRDVVRALLAGGADVNATTTETGVTALMWAVEAPHPDIVHVLLETGADVEVSSSKGFTALLFAVQKGNVEVARLLLAAGADVNGTGSDRTHPLPLAIVSRHADMAYFLLEQGADPNGMIHGVSALHAAAGRVSTWLADWYRRRGMRAASVSGGGRLGLDPASRVPLVRELLARGADPDARIEHLVRRARLPRQPAARRVRAELGRHGRRAGRHAVVGGRLLGERRRAVRQRLRVPLRERPGGPQARCWRPGPTRTRQPTTGARR